MHTNRRLYLDAEGLVCIAHKPYRSVCAAGGAALGLLMLGKKLLPNKPVALFVVIGGIAAGVTGQRLILVTGDDWKILMLAWNVTPEPAATASPTASPSSQ